MAIKYDDAPTQLVCLDPACKFRSENTTQGMDEMCTHIETVHPRIAQSIFPAPPLMMKDKS